MDPAEGTETVEPSGQPEGFVRISDASDEDLAHFLKNRPTVPETVEDERPAASEPPATVTAQTPKPEGSTTTPNVASAPVVTPTKTESALNEDDKPLTRAELAKFQADLLGQLHKQDRRIDAQETHLKRGITKLAEERKAYTDKRNEIERGLEAKKGDPVAISRAVADARDIDNEIARIDNEASSLQNRSVISDVWKHHVKSQDITLDEMTALLQEDGLPPESIAAFRANPYEWTEHPVLLAQYGKRVEDKRVIAKFVDAVPKLIAKIKELQGTVDSKKSSSTAHLKKIQAATKAAPQVTAASGGASDPPDMPDNIDPSSLSDEDLAKLDKQVLSRYRKR